MRPVLVSRLNDWRQMKMFGEGLMRNLRRGLIPIFLACAGGGAVGTESGYAYRAPAMMGADQPVERNDANSRTAHAQLVEKAKRGRIDLYFVGDSITRRWGATDPAYAPMLANWRQNFFGWNAANFGWGGDTTGNILWRLEHGELDGVRPKVIVVQAGTNNVGLPPGQRADAEDVAGGVRAIVELCRKKAPEATIIVTAIFPRNDRMEYMTTINAVNERLARLADGKRVRFLNVNDKLAEKDGKLYEGMMGDGLHPTVRGYQVWAAGLEPVLTELLGPRAEVDHAPPATGDPALK
jgi:lysophospholipase L1-like esterase